MTLLLLLVATLALILVLYLVRRAPGISDPVKYAVEAAFVLVFLVWLLTKSGIAP